MISKYSYQDLVWVDLDTPTEEEIFHITDEYSTPRFVAENISFQDKGTGLEQYSSVIYVKAKLPHFSYKESIYTERCVYFILGQKFIITAHYEFIPSLHEFAKTIEANTILEKIIEADHAGFLFAHMMNASYTYCQDMIDGIKVLLDETSNKDVYKKSTLSDINKILIDVKQCLVPHNSLLKTFQSQSITFYGSNFIHHVTSLFSVYSDLMTSVDTTKDYLATLYHTYISALLQRTYRLVYISLFFVVISAISTLILYLK